VSLVELLGVWRSLAGGEGDPPPTRMSLADWRWWSLDRGEGEKGPGRGEGE